MTATERLLREHHRHPKWTADQWAAHLGVTRIRVHQIKWAHGLAIPHVPREHQRMQTSAVMKTLAELRGMGLTRAAAPELYAKIKARWMRRLKEADAAAPKARPRRSLAKH